MIQAAELQLSCFRFVKHLPETISGRMGQEGAYFLTSPSPSWSPVKTKLKVRDMALAIEAHLRKHFKGRITIGVSAVGHSPMELPEAFKESVQALHLGLHLQKSLLFFEDQYLVADDRSGVSLYEWAPRLVNACVQGTEKEVQFIREQYIKEAIQLSGEKMENLRIHFFHLLFFLLESIQKRSLLMDSKTSDLRGEIFTKFNQANNVADSLSLFRFYLDRLSSIFQTPARGERVLRLEQTKEYISKNYQQPITLKDVAAKAGLSVPHFSRHFKQMFGVGFLEYLIGLRCERAKRLLETTQYPIGHIAQECGFHSTNHFIQCFKGRTKKTPGAYRKRKNPHAGA
jgi:AraC-like DNA-binding protein